MGGKSGGSSYQGPSAYELEQQREGYKAQWEQEKILEDQQAELERQKAEEEAASAELESRGGIKDILANNQRGFTKADGEEDDFLGVV